MKKFQFRGIFPQTLQILLRVYFEKSLVNMCTHCKLEWHPWETYAHSIAYSRDLNCLGLPLKKLCILCRASNAVPVQTKSQLRSIKGIFSDSYSIFLWHESKDIDKKSLFPKFQLIPILRFQVMCDYVCFNAPKNYCVE